MSEVNPTYTTGLDAPDDQDRRTRMALICIGHALYHNTEIDLIHGISAAAQLRLSEIDDEIRNLAGLLALDTGDYVTLDELEEEILEEE